MKKTILITAFLFSFVFAYAQNKEVDAIAAFQIAEESFENQNYTDALRYVSDAQSILGKANGKMLYLKIQILEELSKTNPDYLFEQRSAITEFENIADKEQFSQEKRIAIAKKKIFLKDEIEAFQENEKKQMLADLQNQPVIEKFFTMFPKLNIPLDEFLEHPSATQFIRMTPLYIINELSRGGDYQIPERLSFVDNKESETNILSIVTDENGIVRKYVLQVELEDNNITRLYDMLNISAQNESIANLKKQKKNLIDYYFEGYEIKTKDLQSYLFIDSKLRKTEGSFKRNGKKKNLNYAWIYVQSK